jgi:drug/metabolite transporter (DMT)-like permease
VELWIPITVAAAFFQCTRTALQQRLKALLSTNGANFVRYLYGAPVSILMLASLVTVGGRTLPAWDWIFVAWSALGGVAQIIATSLLIYAFELRNFTVGTAYSKTETVQLAMFSVLVLGEPLGLLPWIGILVSLFGVIVLSVKGDTRSLREIALGWTHKAALVGIAAGGLFGVAAVSIRQGAIHLPTGDFMIRAIFTLAVMNTLQTLIMAVWLLLREPDQLAKVVNTWRSSGLVGLLSVFGSACWAMGFALQGTAYVRALGQIELVFTFIASRYMLHERPTPGELLGSVLVVGGVVLVLLGRQT